MILGLGGKMLAAKYKFSHLLIILAVESNGDIPAPLHDSIDLKALYLVLV